MSRRIVVPLALIAAVVMAIGFSLRAAQRSGRHFLDVALDGGLTVITVFPKETHDGRLQAVYSRAAYPDAAQYVGDCEPSR